MFDWSRPTVFVEIGTIQMVLPARCRMALIADTHIYPSGQRSIPETVLDLFDRAGVDRVVHAGDIASAKVIDQLATIAPVIAVRGNNDSGDFGRNLPHMVEMQIGERLVRLIHGDGGRSARAVATGVAPGADCVIYGHSHIPKVERSGDAVLVNPGSPNDRRWHPHFGVGFLEVRPDLVRPELILFTDSVELAGVNPTWRLDLE
jgi:putative phosphoesterase